MPSNTSELLLKVMTPNRVVQLFSDCRMVAWPLPAVPAMLCSWQYYGSTRMVDVYHLPLPCIPLRYFFVFHISFFYLSRGEREKIFSPLRLRSFWPTLLLSSYSLLCHRYALLFHLMEGQCRRAACLSKADTWVCGPTCPLYWESGQLIWWALPKDEKQK